MNFATNCFSGNVSWSIKGWFSDWQACGTSNCFQFLNIYVIYIYRFQIDDDKYKKWFPLWQNLLVYWSLRYSKVDLKTHRPLGWLSIFYINRSRKMCSMYEWIGDRIYYVMCPIFINLNDQAEGLRESFCYNIGMTLTLTIHVVQYQTMGRVNGVNIFGACSIHSSLWNIKECSERCEVLPCIAESGLNEEWVTFSNVDSKINGLPLVNIKLWLCSGF